MNRLVIIGNGFDLSLGLKTTYNDFLIQYLKDCVDEIIQQRNRRINRVWNEQLKVETFENHDELIHVRLPERLNYNDLIIEMDRCDTFIQLTNLLENKGKVEFDFNLIEEIYENSLVYNWVDFEVTYYDTLLKLYDKYEGLNNKEQRLKEFHEKFEIFKNKFIDYLTNIDFNYRDNKVMDFYFNTSNRFTKDLLVTKPIKKLMLLSFNYTRSVREFKNYIHDVECEVNYIHGNLEDKKSVIFGFGDELDQNYTTIERERTQELFKNIKSVHYFKYPNYNKLHSFIGFSEEYEVYIYGHSCGISDRTLLNEIFENKNCKTIRIFYHKLNESEDNFQDISVGLIRQFTDKSRMRQIVMSKLEQDTLYQLNS